MWKWREIHSLHFHIYSLFPTCLSISYIKNCHILSQNVKYGTCVANDTKNLPYAPSSEPTGGIMSHSETEKIYNKDFNICEHQSQNSWKVYFLSSGHHFEECFERLWMLTVLKLRHHQTSIATCQFIQNLFRDYTQDGLFLPCAVKSLNADVGLEERIEFLKEAATMEKCRQRKKLFFVKKQTYVRGAFKNYLADFFR